MIGMAYYRKGRNEMSMWKKQRSLLAAVCLMAAACSSSTQDLSVRAIVEELADDELLGRDNQSGGAVDRT